MSKVTHHEGHTITLTDDFDFEVSGPAFKEDDRNTFESLREAKAAINEALEVEARAKLKARTTKIQVIDDAGEPVTVTGINRSSRQLTGLKRDRTNYVYPNVAWIKIALQELEKINADVRSRRMQLRPFSIDAKRGYGHISPTQYDGIVDAFEHEVKEKTQKAEKGPPELKPAQKEAYY